MSLGTFALLKNEAPWIAAHLLNLLPVVDEMVFYDGNSTDGTLEIIEAIKSDEKDGHKIKLFRNADPRDLKDSYVEMFNSCLRSLSTDLAWFAHPDFYCVDPSRILAVKDSPAVALSTQVKSFAGEPGGELLRIKGRSESWKNIYRLRNPDLGAHYFGHYGAHNEDVYYSAITGNTHEHHGKLLDRYPYEVEVSGIEIFHFSDVRTYERRLGRMLTCLENQGWPLTPAELRKKAENHPRVSLKSNDDFTFKPAEYPAEMLANRAKYSHLEKTLVKA